MTPEVKERIDQIRHGIVPEGYRKAGIDIIPSDWDKSPFRQLGVIASGLVDPQKQPYSEMQHIGPDSIEKDTGRILETKSASELGLISGKFFFDSDSIVYSKIRPNLNKVCAPPFEGICSADCYSIKPTGKIEKAYLFNLMLGYNFYKRAIACSMRTGMPKINQDDLNAIAISYPQSTTEQKKIAEILSVQDKLIELEQQKIEEIKKAKRFFLEKMFPKEGQAVPEIRFKGFTDPWEQRKVSDLAEKTYGGGTPTTSNEEYWNGDIPWIQSSDVVDGKLLGVEPRKWITQDGLNNSAAQLIPGNSIAIITRVGVGKLAFMPYSYATSQDFLSLSKLNAEPLFTVYACYKKLQSELNAVQGTSIKGITKDELLAKNIMVPRYAEQQQIGAFFKQLDHLITLHQRKLEEEKRKKKTLMQLLLTGLVRVNA